MCTLIQCLGFMLVCLFGGWVCLLFFNCLVGCFRMTVWTPAVLSVLYACVLYFCICPCSAQLSMFHMERRSRNTLIITISQACYIVEIYHSDTEPSQSSQQHTKCIPVSNLPRQLGVLPHWDKNGRSHVLFHPVIVFWHLTSQCKHWHYNARRLAAQPLENQFPSCRCDLTEDSRGVIPGLLLLTL